MNTLIAGLLALSTLALLPTTPPGHRSVPARTPIAASGTRPAPCAESASTINDRGSSGRPAAPTSVPGRAINLARQGFVVFTYDMIGYNDSRQLPHTFGGQRENLWGLSLAGLQLWNSIRGLDFLESLDYVRRDAIGVTGASGGGTQTFLLAAIDERVAAAAPVNMISLHMQGGCLCENLPGLRLAVVGDGNAMEEVRARAGETNAALGREAVVLTGAQVRAYLEYSAKYFRTVAPGAPVDPETISDPNVPDYNYDVFSGVDYETGVEAAQEFSRLVAQHLGTVRPATAALAWVIQQPGVTTVIPGARSPEQAQANAAAGSLPAIPEEFLAAVAELYDRRLRAVIHPRW